MGQKVHPIGFRLGSYRKWDSVWFARKDFSSLVLEDRKIREFIKVDKELKGSGIAGLDIKRAANKLTIKIHTSRPGMVIGQKGKKIEDLRRRSATRDVPVIVLTTRAGTKHVSLARRLGVRHYVAKPVEEQSFIRLVGSVTTLPEAALSVSGRAGTMAE